MIAMPAIDLRGGRCVQLVGGRAEDERVSLPDPVAIASRWRGMGFTGLHLVDLDAALGRGDNRELLLEVAAATDATTQAGGGLRADEDVASVLSAGVDRAVVGTRAVEEPAWLADVAASHPDRLVVAADVRDGQVLTRGWTEGTGMALEGFLEGLSGLPIAGVLCTDVGREGRMVGVDALAVRALVEHCPHPVWVSGGVGSMHDLNVIAEAGAAGAVLGMALYTGTLDGERVAEEFGG